MALCKNFDCTTLNRTTKDSYTFSLTVEPFPFGLSVAQRSRRPPDSRLACSRLPRWRGYDQSDWLVCSQRVFHCANVLWFDLVQSKAELYYAGQERLRKTRPILAQRSRKSSTCRKPITSCKSRPILGVRRAFRTKVIEDEMKGEGVMDATQLLKKDHKEVKALL
jgi:hypothetical protein